MSGEKNKSVRKKVSSRRILLWLAVSIAAVLLILFISAFFLDEPLRRWTEAGMNRALEGYSVTLEEADFHPLGFSLTVRGLVLRQDAHPEPPVAIFPEVDTSIHWRSLLSGRLVSDWHLKEPKLYVNLSQLRKENKDDVPVQKRGWQEAVKEIYPLEINRLEIDGGEFTYVDEDPDRPLRLSGIQATATNIRNIESREHTYPSSFSLAADIFEQGHGRFEGRADFLAEPHPGLDARFDFRGIPLDRLRPVGERANLKITGGVLRGQGELEYAPEKKSLHLGDLEVSTLRLDYVHAAATAEAEKKRAEKAKESVKGMEMFFLIDRLRLTGEAGLVNRAADPAFRVFINQADLQITNLSNRFRQGPAKARLDGRFMGTGKTEISVNFRPEKQGADFDMSLKIEGTRLPAMNNLLRAYGNFDVVDGSFSLFSELSVRGRKVEGYIKPFFTDLDVYDRRQDEEKGLFRKMYEGLVGGIGQLLENPSEKVATKAEVSGTIENPEASTWQIIIQLIKNGFFKSILPGFEQQVSGRESREKEENR